MTDWNLFERAKKRREASEKQMAEERRKAAACVDQAKHVHQQIESYVRTEMSAENIPVHLKADTVSVQRQGRTIRVRALSRSEYSVDDGNGIAREAAENAVLDFLGAS